MQRKKKNNNKVVLSSIIYSTNWKFTWIFQLKKNHEMPSVYSFPFRFASFKIWKKWAYFLCHSSLLNVRFIHTHSFFSLSFSFSIAIVQSKFSELFLFRFFQFDFFFSALFDGFSIEILFFFAIETAITILFSLLASFVLFASENFPRLK